jgi:hypothetical protein
MDLTELRKKQREARLDAAFMTASSVLTWIAFRDPDPLAWQEDTKTYDRILSALPDLSVLQAMALVRQVKQGAALDTPALRIVAQEVEVERGRRDAINAATQTLLKEISAGRLSAYGREDRWGQQTLHRVLPIEIFMDSQVTVTTRDRVQQGAALLNGGINRGPGYCDVKFKTGEVLSVWEQASENAQTTNGQISPSTRTYTSADVDRWYQAYLKSFLNDAFHPSLARDLAAARAKFDKSVPRAMIESLREQWVPAARRPVGRRPRYPGKSPQ